MQQKQEQQQQPKKKASPRKAVLIPAIILAVIAVLLLAVWCIPMPAGRWGKQDCGPGYTGAFAKNNALDTLAYLDLGEYSHPETVLVREGWVYCTVKNGVLLKMREDGTERTRILDTGGCLLGFAFDGAGDILAVDCDYGGTGALLRVSDAENGACEVLVSRASGWELYYPNAIAVASDGTVYFSDSSRAFPPVKYQSSSSLAAANEALMHTCTGRVLSYHPRTGQVNVLADGFAFSNGLGLSADEKTLFVCETYAYAVRKIDLVSGEVSDFLVNLPGFPDNLTEGLDGKFWVGFNGERSDSLDAISQKALLRKALWLYGKLAPSGEDPGKTGYCHVFAFTEDGAVTDSLQSGVNGYYRSTGATETRDRLYIQSINDSGKLAFLQLPAEGN